jgi:cell division septal protein FtsQ
VSRVAAPRRTTARVAALPGRGNLPELGHLAPSPRSLAVGLVIVALAVLAYVGARETSVFAVQAVDVRGGTPALRAEVRSALADVVGTSLLKVGDATVDARLAPISGVRTFTFDRAFPHTLRVVVKREVPVLVVRRVPGKQAFLVAASGRVLKELPHARLSHLPRLWVKKDVPVTVGAPLPPSLAGAATALGTLRGAGLPGSVSSVQAGRDELTLRLSGGLEVLLGDTGDLRLKLAIARRILRLTGAATGGGYLDVSLPQRPVLNQNSQVGG